MSLIELAPRVEHRAESELPFVDIGDGQHLQLLQVDLDHGLWIVRARFEPGNTIPRHLHTGSVFAFTISGSWHYLEYPEVVNTAGSYLFEPAGSVHTLHVPASNEGLTDVWFAIYGANLNLRDDDSVEMVIDAHAILAYYRALCEAQGVTDPPVIGAVKAAVTAAPGDPLQVTEVPEPTPGAGELLVAVHRCGICGSDLHNSGLAPTGQVLGHEMAGEVVGIGAGVDPTWREGQRVAVFPLVGCGRCRACLEGRTIRCPEVEMVGYTRPGGFAELIAVGAAETVPLPDLLSDAEGALVEPLAVGLNAYRSTDVAPGEPVLIVGGGPVGLAVLVWARHLGVGPVVVSEPTPARRAMAERLGAATVDPTAGDPAGDFERLTGHRPSAVIECAGKPGIVAAAMDLADADARITVAGLCTAPDTVFHLSGLMKALTLRYVLYYEHRDYLATLALLGDDRFDATPLITDTIGLDALPDRFEALKSPTDDVKVQVDPRR